MPLYGKDDTTARFVAELARKCGATKQDAGASRREAELQRIAEAIPLRVGRGWTPPISECAKSG
jgi:hypothetical protein